MTTAQIDLTINDYNYAVINVKGKQIAYDILILHEALFKSKYNCHSI